jgi:hypothetical protein
MLRNNSNFHFIDELIEIFDYSTLCHVILSRFFLSKHIQKLHENVGKLILVKTKILIKRVFEDISVLLDICAINIYFNHSRRRSRIFLGGGGDPVGKNSTIYFFLEREFTTTITNF